MTRECLISELIQELSTFLKLEQLVKEELYVAIHSHDEVHSCKQLPETRRQRIKRTIVMQLRQQRDEMETYFRPILSHYSKMRHPGQFHYQGDNYDTDTERGES
jgi:hypothetical protein